MPLPHLPRLADARVSTSRPKPHQTTRWYRRLDTPQCCLKASPPIATRLRRGGSPTSRPPPSPASHWTGMPRQPSHDAQRRVPLQIDARRARSLPSRPRLTRPSTLTTLMPPPRLRRAAASKIVTPTHAAGSPPPPSGLAHGRPAAYACYEGVKRRARPCPVKHLSRRGATTPLSPLPHWLHGGQGHCTAALAAAAQPWWSGGGDSLTSRPRPREGISKLSL